MSLYPNVPGVGRDIEVVNTGVKLNGAPVTVATPPPQLGEHALEIWCTLGLSAQDVADLTQKGAI